MDLAGALLHLFRCQGDHVSELVVGYYHRRIFKKCNGRVPLLTNILKQLKKNLCLTHAYSEKKEHSVWLVSFFKNEIGTKRYNCLS